jgi:hypothetical protein
MEQSKEIELPPIQTVTATESNPAGDHDESSKSSGDAKEGVPEADYSSKSANKTSVTHYLVLLPHLISNLSEL